MGTPSAFHHSGTDIAGCPVMLAITPENGGNPGACCGGCRAGPGRLGELGGVLGDLDPAVGTGQHRAYRHGQDRGQLVAFPAAAAVIEDAVQGGQQPAAGAGQVQEVEVWAGNAHAGSATSGQQGDDSDVEAGGQQRADPRVQGLNQYVFGTPWATLVPRVRAYPAVSPTGVNPAAA